MQPKNILKFMPLIPSAYKAPFYYFNNAHLQTIVPSTFRKVEGVKYVRQRIETPDQDFLDLDWAKMGSKKLVLVVHGLEGNADRHYVKGMVKIFNAHGFDALGYNFRSCSGEMNRQARLYHHGDTPDLDFTLNYVLQHTDYEQIALVGFSMGGNLILKYLGEKSENLNPKIFTAFAVSVPCHLKDCSYRLEEPSNRLYKKRFLGKLLKKLEAKAEIINHIIPKEKIPTIKTLQEFDDFFTAPTNGFIDHLDYYARTACGQFLDKIRIPVYILSAKNDPMLPESCFPVELAKKSNLIHLEISRQGGHVGFELWASEHTYSEKKALEWVQKCQK